MALRQNTPYLGAVTTSAYPDGKQKLRWHRKQPAAVEVVEAVVAGWAAISTFLSVFFFLAALFLCLCSE